MSREAESAKSRMTGLFSALTEKGKVEVKSTSTYGLESY